MSIPPPRPTSGTIPDRRLDTRLIRAIAGAYTLASRRGATGQVEVFACRTQSISARAVAVVAPVAGKVGEPLTAKFNDLGIIRGVVERQTPEGFVFTVEMTDAERITLAGRIEWLRRKVAGQVQDRRAHPRFQPRNPGSCLRLGDGKVLDCFVIDLSRSGASISVDAMLPAGSSVVLGDLPARVIRRLPVGYALAFEGLQEMDGLERAVAVVRRAG